MSHPKEPARLLDPNAGADPLLREALTQVSRDLPSDAQIEALAERTVAAAMGPSAGGSALAAGAGKGALLKLAGVLVLGGAVLAWRVRRPEPSPSPAVTAVAQHPADAAVVEPLQAAKSAASPTTYAVGTGSTAREQTAAPELAPATTQAPVSAPAAKATRPANLKTSARPARDVQVQSPGITTRSVAPAAVASNGSGVSSEVNGATSTSSMPAAQHEPPSELSLVHTAQQLIGHHPRRALEALDQHRTLYPRGTFAEERDALQLDALARLGWREALAQAGDAFLKRYPTSLHRERVEQLLRNK